jgi:hypothetical protein
MRWKVGVAWQYVPACVIPIMLSNSCGVDDDINTNVNSIRVQGQRTGQISFWYAMRFANDAVDETEYISNCVSVEVVSVNE